MSYSVSQCKELRKYELALLPHRSECAWEFKNFSSIQLAFISIVSLQNFLSVRLRPLNSLSGLFFVQGQGKTLNIEPLLRNCP
ncbi:unnamed protein product [Protopolystoma xenopodis]|uniref:Uncharacterized protein n=1 Tax=Protopolystoma xenopodis TaxID=117903 RepID=A0A3S5CFL7_9PLAT|nr:unnamed protein product [Protopolystoma xenopodis]